MRVARALCGRFDVRKKKSAVSPDIYRIKVTLLGTEPPIWRRLLVPASLTLKELHGVLQVAMGWEDSHLHDFRIGQKRFGEPDPERTLMGGPGICAESTARLIHVLGRAGATAVYTYDFGDSWEHEIVVEEVLPPAAGQAYPVCVAGERHGPPEDCGGVPGYCHMLEAVTDPKHHAHEEMRDWLGDDFDPEAFSVDAVNRWLAPARRPRGKAYST